VGAPIDLSPLRLADAALVLKTGGITFDKFDFGPTNIVVSLVSGKLTADLKQTSLFDGAGGASFVADGSGAKPAIALKANLDGMALKPFLVACRLRHARARRWNRHSGQAPTCGDGARSSARETSCSTMAC
jgi:hypothetical protein